MLLEKRHFEDPTSGGWGEFHSTESSVECRFYATDGGVDFTKDGLHSILMVYHKDAMTADIFLSIDLVRNGVVSFDKESAKGDWTFIPDKCHRLLIMNDYQLSEWIRYMQKKVPNFLQLSDFGKVFLVLTERK